MKMTNYLLGYKNLKIVQDPDMFKFSLDSILLPKFMTLNYSYKKILDIGTGNAPIPLILSTMTKASILGVEVQKDVFEMGVESVNINDKTDQIKLVNGDINELYKDMPAEEYDAITCNPPFFKVTTSGLYNKNDYKTLARHEVMLDIPRLLKISRKLLKNGGNLDIVHRPERLVDILVEMRNNNIEPKKIRYVYPKNGENANILLIEGTKNGKPGLKIMDPLYVYNEYNEYTEEVTKSFSD